MITVSLSLVLLSLLLIFIIIISSERAIVQSAQLQWHRLTYPFPFLAHLLGNVINELFIIYIVTYAIPTIFLHTYDDYIVVNN